MTGWREIERAVLEVLKSRGIKVAGDVGFSLHFVAAVEYPMLPGSAGSSLPTRCPLMAQVGEDCGMKVERVDVTELAKQIEEALR